MAVFLLEGRENEGRQADFCRKEASLPILEKVASFSNGAHFSRNLMMSNKIDRVFSLGHLVFILQLFIQSHVQSQFSGICS